MKQPVRPIRVGKARHPATADGTKFRKQSDRCLPPGKARQAATLAGTPSGATTTRLRKQSDRCLPAGRARQAATFAGTPGAARTALLRKQFDLSVAVGIARHAATWVGGSPRTSAEGGLSARATSTQVRETSTTAAIAKGLAPAMQSLPSSVKPQKSRPTACHACARESTSFSQIPLSEDAPRETSPLSTRST